MSVTRVVRRKGANIVVQSNAEVLLMPGGEVHGWTRRFANRTRDFSAAYAPINKRPRWAHYGKPLKGTIVSAPPRFRMLPGDRQRVYAAVGSSAPHAYYVDQGTGVYAGGSPYQGKILPPWTRGHPSLYEHTWKAPERGPNGVVEWNEIGTVTIKGQRGQFFFEKGLKRAFQFMRMRSYQVPADPRISDILSATPIGDAEFRGNTEANPAFIAQLNEWRAWRDEAFTANRMLGARPETFSGGRRDWHRLATRRAAASARKAERDAARRKKNADRVRKWRAEQKMTGADKKPKSAADMAAEKRKRAIQSDRQRFVRIILGRYPAERGYKVGITFEGGQWRAHIEGPGLPQGGKDMASSVKF